MKFFNRWFGLDHHETPAQQVPEMVSEAKPEEWPKEMWIEDEDTLRDEGVIFGLNDVDTAPKMAAIKHYYAQQIGPLEIKLSELGTKIDELNLKIGEKDESLEVLSARQQNWEAKATLDQSEWPRNILQFAISLFLTAFVYYWVHQSVLQLVNAPYATFTVLLLGLSGGLVFSMRQGLAYQIFGVLLPVSAAFFVFLAQMTLLQGIIALLCLGAFMVIPLFYVQSAPYTYEFFKKAILKPLLRPVVLPYLSFRKKAAQQKTNILRQDRWAILPNYNQTTESLRKLESLRDKKIAVFESEVLLAQKAKEMLDERAIKRIVS